ncbi:hypothetical protein Tco_0135005 [Tanacetum coccineum]
MKMCKSFIPLLTEVTSRANNASQSMAWSDALNFKRMAYECIFSSGLTRIIPTPEPSSIASLPRRHLEEIHVTYAHLEKKRTRLRTCTNIAQEFLYSSWRRRHKYNVTTSQR